VVNTAYGLGNLDERARLEGGVAQVAQSSPLLYIFTTSAAQAYSNSVVDGYLLPRLLPMDIVTPQLTKRSRTDKQQQTRCLMMQSVGLMQSSTGRTKAAVVLS